jgi:hypothetical protein
MRATRRHAIAALLVSVNAATLSHPCRAQSPAAAPSVDSAKDAESHFRSGVVLYKDGDPSGALVEFKRAYELEPNYRVLYNIGQTYFQLQRYAEALTALASYLSAGGSQVPSARRSSVQEDIRQLHARVAQVDVRVSVDGAQVLVDDQPVGTSPIEGPVLVSLGHRRISASKVGWLPQERFVDVAAGDHATVSLELQTGTSPSAASPPAPPMLVKVSATPAHPTQEATTSPARPPQSSPPWLLWGATGVLAAATTVTGILTLSARSDLSSQLGSFPGNADAIDQARSRAKAFGLVTDGLLVATTLAGGIALYATFAGSGSQAARKGVEAGLGASGIQLRFRY